MKAAPLLARHLFRRVVGVRRTLALMALAATAALVFVVASIGGEQGDADLYQGLTVALGAGTVSIALLVVGVDVLREERDGGTLPYLFVKPIPRWAFAGAAWAAGVLASLVIALFGWAAGWAAAGVITGSWAVGLSQLPTFAGAAAGYASVFVPLGYLVPRAILVGLGYLFVWEGILASFVPGLAQWSIWRIAVSITAAGTDLPSEALDVLGPVEPGVGGGVLKLTGVAVAGLLVLIWALRHRDAL